jgi:hypothetical protein
VLYIIFILSLIFSKLKKKKKIILTNLSCDLKYVLLLIFRFFQSLDWASVDKKKLVPPIVPNVKSENDTRNYILYNGNTAITAEAVSEEELRLFHDF